MFSVTSPIGITYAFVSLSVVSTGLKKSLQPLSSMNKLDDHIESTKSKSLSFKENNVKTLLRSLSLDDHHFSKLAKVNSFESSMMIRRSLSFNGSGLKKHGPQSPSGKPLPEPKVIEPKTQGPKSPSTKPLMNRDVAAIKLQKTYKGYRTRRHLADSGVLVNEIWSKCLDFGLLKNSSVSFFDDDKPETVVSRWSRARTQAAKVGKGLSKNEMARKLALQHWLEAIDPRHRYGHNLQFYYAKWLLSESNQPFFYWLDVGEGKEVDLEKCPRTKLLRQCIKYLGPTEREAYEVIVEDGKFMYKLSKTLIDTTGGPNDTGWIFVLSPSMVLYIGMKQKGKFAHSSFLAGGATISAGRLVIRDGFLESVWPYSGHYIPTEENFDVFMSFLEQHHVHFAKKQNLEDVLSATNNFSNENLIAKGALGNVYKGRWYKNLTNVVVQRKPMITDDGVMEEVDKIVDPNLQKQMDTEVLALYKNILYNCLNQECVQRPTMDQIVKELEEVLELQWKHANLEQTTAADEGASSNSLKMDLLYIPLSEIRMATRNFDEAYVVGSGGYEYLTKFKYKKESDIYSFGVVLFEVMSGRLAYDSIYIDENHMGLAPIARKRFNEGTLKELLDPKIFVEDDDQSFTLNRGPNEDSFDAFTKVAYHCLAETQAKRPTMEVVIKELQKALRAHGDTMVLMRFLLRDILLATENFAETYCTGLDTNGMVYKAELNHVHPMNQKICMKVYEDLAYQTLGKRKMESDVYSFGVVLFETFCGRVAYDPVYMAQNDNGLAPIASQCFNDGTIWTIIDPCLKEETSENMFTSKTYSFYIFLSIAYKCSGEPAARPTMEMVIMELERALNIHTNQYFPTSIADEIMEEIRSLVGRDINSMRVS
ncbi:hypothetical protein QVD17_37457 [Tagetes erecta]|uniref:Uncharacterized protein n=1 Tax=Tagetes erecta TaxID=13708 RepID=A0AAD8JU31_TARER|nr:hypothetical protein QVD17_37457 [Tagetes erecta]